MGFGSTARSSAKLSNPLTNTDLMSTVFPALYACATCMGNADDHNTRAASFAVLFMLVILFAVFAGCIRFIFFLAKCEKRSIAMAQAKVATGTRSERPLPKH